MNLDEKRKKIEKMKRASDMWNNSNGSNTCVLGSQKERREKNGAEKYVWRINSQNLLKIGEIHKFTDSRNSVIPNQDCLSLMKKIMLGHILIKQLKSKYK